MNRKLLDTVFHGGPIYGAKDFNKPVEAVGVKGERIVAVGKLEKLETLCGPKTLLRDLSGKCLTPGFLDPHTHFSITAFAPLMADCRTPPLGSIGEIINVMRERAARTEIGRWVIGWGYNEAHIRDARHPSLSEMERACSDHPAILIHASFHQCVLNPLAMDLCGVDRYTKHHSGGRIGMGALGNPNGLLFEKAAQAAFQFARRDLLSRARKEAGKLFTDNSNRHLGLGIVRLADAGVSPIEKELYLELSSRDPLPISIDLMEVGEKGMFAPPLHLLKNGYSRGKPSTVKLFLDGGEHCAIEMSILEMIQGLGRFAGKMLMGRHVLTGLRSLTQSPVRFDREGRIHIGFFINDPPEMEKIVEEAHRQGYPVATHALGNAAVSHILGIYERVQDRLGAPKRPFRIEHSLFLTRHLIQRMAKVQVAAVVQPTFIYDYGPLLQSQPLPRSLKILPLREMIDAGVLVSGSSDEPCAREDPLLGMDCAVHRKVPDGECVDPEQAISKEEALMLYTRNAARVMGCEDEAGSLEEGKQADLVILSKDPFRYGFQEVKVVETIVKGRTVWRESL